MGQALGRCERCGATLPATAIKGLCPRCLFVGTLEDGGHSAAAGDSDIDAATGRKPASLCDEWTGKHLGGYRILSRVGEGGMGVVYRAWEEELQRVVALKVPSARLTKQPGFADLVERFRQEARAAASLSHPAICPIYSMGKDQGVHYFAMEFVEGVSLSEYIRKHGPLEPARALGIVSQAASALAAAHSAGIIHRDIKPANIMLVGRGEAAAHHPPENGSGRTAQDDSVRVMDFGLAKWTEAHTSRSAAGGFLGTLAYASPEQCAGSDLDGRSDLYSLGVVLYEALTGRLPYDAKTPAAMVSEIQSPTPIAIRERLPTVSTAMEEALRRLLAKSPEDRFADARSLWENLQEVLGKHPTAPGPGVLVVVSLGEGRRGDSPAPQPGEIRAKIPDSWKAVVGDVLPEFSGAEDCAVGGRGMAASFTRPSEAVRFALSVSRQLREMKAAQSPAPCPGIGIHMGEIETVSGDAGTLRRPARATIDMARALMGLSAPGQILMTLPVFDAARQAMQAGREVSTLAWLAHGPYLLEGIETPVGVAEVGVEGLAPLAPPDETEAAKRLPLGDEQTVLGWRPAVDLAIPQRPNWRLAEKRGEGGFGEVWLATNAYTDQKRIFKFCFEAKRVRALKREVTLLRLLKETLGRREDICELIDWQFESPPYFLESAYTEGGALGEWVEQRGGVGQIPLEERLEIVAQVAEAVAAAHSVGVLHKDIKPSNILMRHREGRPCAALTDFGIGLLTRRDALQQKGITVTGLTGITLFADQSSSATAGTRMYMAPELFEGATATTRSDIFSLGVLLYQFVAGDLSRALTVGWQRHIDDDLLREDIRSCVEGEPERRLASADELARNLRTLPGRRAARRDELEARERDRRMQAQIRRARRRRRLLAIIGAIALIYLVSVSFLFLRATRASREAKRQRGVADTRATEAERARQTAEKELYDSTMVLASRYLREGQYGKVVEMLWETAPESCRNWEWGYLVNRTHTYERSLAGHEGAVRRCDFDPAGHLVTASNDETAIIWDCSSGERLHTLRGHRGAVQDARYSPDGTLIVTGSSDGSAKIWNPETGEEVHSLIGHGDGVQVARFDPAGGRVVTASVDGDVFLWDAVTGNRIHALKGHGGPVNRVAFSPDGRHLMTSARPPQPGETRLWDTRTGEQLARWKPAEGMAISPDGKTIAMAWVYHVSTRDIATGEVVLDLQSAHMNNVTAIVFSPDGQRLATAAEDGNVRIWNAVTGRLAHSLDAHTSMVRKLEFSGDGRMLVSASVDGSAKLWGVESGAETGSLLGHREEVLDAAVDAGGRFLATASADGTAKLWLLESAGRGPAFREVCAPGPGAFQHRFSPDGRLVYRRYLWALPTGCVLDAATGIEFASFTLSRTPPDTATEALYHWVAPDSKSVFSDDGRRLALVSPAGAVNIHEIETGLTAAVFQTQSPDTDVLRFSHDGQLLATANGTTVDVWNVDAGQSVLTLTAHDADVSAAAFSADQESIATLSQADNMVRVWGLHTGALQGTFARPNEQVRHIAFAAPGLRVLTSAGGVGNIRIWDPATESLCANLSGHQGFVETACLSPDAQRVVTASDDRTLRVWAAEGGVEYCRLEWPGGELPVCVQRSSDGQRYTLVTGSGRVVEWEAAPWRLEDLPGDASLAWRDRFETWRRSNSGRRARFQRLRDEYDRLLGLESEPLFTLEEAARRRAAWDCYAADFHEATGCRNLEAERQRDWYANWPPPQPQAARQESESRKFAAGDLDVVGLGDGVVLDMVWAPAGEFRIGRRTATPGIGFQESHQHNESGRPQTWLRMNGFWIGRCEVTRRQFGRFVEATSHTPGQVTLHGRACDWQHPGFAESFEQSDRHPVVCVTWDDAMAFCDWLSTRTGETYTLPTEAQWEYACRAGTDTLFPWGDDPNGWPGWGNALDQSGHKIHREVFFENGGGPDHNDGFPFTAPVAAFRANAWGLHDCLGNVLEWCLSLYAAYPYREEDGRNDPGRAGLRAVRGGCYLVYPFPTSASRTWGPGGHGTDPDGCSPKVGFRVARIPH